MKLRFSLQYRTAWGESLHVVLTYKGQNGASRSQNLLMQTNDGEQWAVETSAVHSRQQRIDRIAYHYQVEDEEGRVLRKEWTGVERSYAFDVTKDYSFPDQWRDIPLQHHLYTRAYQATTGTPTTPFEPPRLPLFRKSIVFRVSAPQVGPDHYVGLCGNHPSIGSWNPTRFLRMEPCGDGEWMLSVNADTMMLPLEYKYVVVSRQSNAVEAWEEGDNRNTGSLQIADGEVLVLTGETLRLKEQTWRVAGVVVPLFSLRSEHSYGVGDLGDLRRFIDWVALTGMKMVQLLPINDTTATHRWGDSYPYNIVSCFAIHPSYIDLEEAGVLKDKRRMTHYRRQQRELNALAESDYEAVERVKSAYLHELFTEQGERTLKSDDYLRFFEQNKKWLEPFADHYYFFVQYHLFRQLKAAADHAHAKGIALKGDIPIGVKADSMEVHEHPEYFYSDMQTGAPPDAFSRNGQNWGFPTYNWDALMRDDCSWWRERLAVMQRSFDAFRLDHVLGFFRIWEIPEQAVSATLGHFSPALPLSAEEIEYFGLTFRREMLTKPFINDRVVERLFGIHAAYVKENFLDRKAYGLYSLRPEVATQRQVEHYFSGKTDENSLWIRDALYQLVADVLFVEDPRQEGMFHPRIGAYNEPVYEALSSEDKDAYMRIYNNYYFQRHNHLWAQTALRRLPTMLEGCRMLVCGEDLGMLPDCVPGVLDALRILTLEVQSMPKQAGFEFAHIDGYPYRSVATISTHDMAPLRLWWEESPERTQRYYATMLQKEGRAPRQLPAHLAEQIVARHLYGPSMLCMISLQDWLATDTNLRRKQPYEERINVPSDPFNHWSYRMHLSIEQLIKEDKFNQKLHTMIERSRRL